SDTVTSDMAADEVADEAAVALDGPGYSSSDENRDSSLYTVPPQISKYFSDFGHDVRRMQFENASQVMQTAIEAARANDGEGYGRNTSEVASWKEILTAFGQLAFAEAHYIQLPFLHNIRHLVTRKEAEMRRHYGVAIDSFTRIASHLLPGTVPHHICEQSLAFCDARDTLIACHRRIVTANESYEEALDTIEESLQRVCAMVREFHHPLLSDLAHNFSLESDLLRSLISIQRSVLYTGILETTIRLKEIRERLLFWLKDIDWGSNRKGLFSSSLKPAEKWARCRLFAYLHSYHAWLALKYTFLFHETLGPYVNPLEAPKEGDDSMDGLTMHEVLAPIKKREKDALMVILIDRSRDSDMLYIAGRDYKCPRDGNTPFASSLPSGRFPLLYVHAPDKQSFAAHYGEMADAIRSSQAALDEKKRVHIIRRKDKDKYTTYFYERL
ncbi:hypothetical protein PRIPAC_72518, partial [Pristionchus pacificus]